MKIRSTDKIIAIKTDTWPRKVVIRGNNIHEMMTQHEINEHPDTTVSFIRRTLAKLPQFEKVIKVLNECDAESDRHSRLIADLRNARSKLLEQLRENEMSLDGALRDRQKCNDDYSEAYNTMIEIENYEFCSASGACTHLVNDCGDAVLAVGCCRLDAREAVKALKKLGAK